MKALVTLDPHGRLYYENGVYLGAVIASEDGYYYFWPAYPDKGGYWSAEVLRGISDLLDDKNRDWDQIIQNDPAIGGKGE